MKKGFISLAIFFLFSSLSLGAQIHLKLSSGLWRIDPRDVKAALEGWEELHKLQAASQPGWSLEDGEVDFFRLGMAFEAEILISLSSRLALGASAGYIFSELTEDEASLLINENGIFITRARPTKISAYPFVLSGYFSFPLGSKFHVYLKGGGGYMRAKYIDRDATKRPVDQRFTYTAARIAEAGSPAYLGGIGLAFSFDPSISFFLEAEAHSAKVQGFSNADPSGEKEALYFYEEYVPELDYWQAKLGFSAQAPGGGNVRSAREAAVDFSGFSAKIGVRLKF